MRTFAGILVAASIGLFFAGAFTLGVYALLVALLSDLWAEVFDA